MDAPDNVAVSVIDPPFSAIESDDLLNVTDGASSSSVKVAVTCCSSFSVPFTTFNISIITVLSPVYTALSIAVNSIVPVKLPAGIVSVVTDAV